MNPYMSDAANGTNTDGSLMSYWQMWQHIMDVQWIAYLWVYGCIFAVMAGGQTATYFLDVLAENYFILKRTETA